MSNTDQKADIRQSMARLDSFRTLCLLGEAPASITVDGFTFRDELEAEGYLAELGAALDELEQETVTASPPVIEVSGASLGVVKDFKFEGVSEMPEMPPGPYPTEISVTFDMEFDPKILEQVFRNIHVSVQRIERARFRQERPFRNAVRRSLSRKRIAATRRWHEGATMRAVYDDLYKEFGLGSYGWGNERGNPFKGLKRHECGTEKAS